MPLSATGKPLMDNYSSELNRLITSPETLSADALRDLVARYPYFPLPAMELLKRFGPELDEAETARLRRRAAIVSGDRKALFDLMSERAESFATIYPPAPESEPVSYTHLTLPTNSLV